MFRPHAPAYRLGCASARATAGIAVLCAALSSFGCAALTQPDDITIVAEPPSAPAPPQAALPAAALPGRAAPQASPGTG